MNRRSTSLAFVLALGLASFARLPFAIGQEKDKLVEPPIAGRPAKFSGAVGTFQVGMRAEPNELQAEDSLRLTVRITGTGNLEQLRRPNLQKLPSFAKRFHIVEGGDRYLAQEKAREFDYLLRPRDAGVNDIPPLPFVFFKPGLNPEHLGYQTTYAPAISILVKPRPHPGEGKILLADVPSIVYELATTQQMLQRREPFAFLGWAVILSVLVAPPLLCLIGYQIYWRYANAGQPAQRHGHRARNRATSALHRLRRKNYLEQAASIPSIIVSYLREAFDIDIKHLGPDEVGRRLGEIGFDSIKAEQIVEFLGACDAARFAPRLDLPGRDLTREAAELVAQLGGHR